MTERRAPGIQVRMPLAARLAVAAAYLAFICWWAWLTGETEDGDSATSLSGGLAVLAFWIGGAVLTGALIGPWAFALPFAMAIAASVLWQRVDWFSQEFAAVNALIEAVVEAVLIAPGVWLRRRRRRRAAGEPAG